MAHFLTAIDTRPLLRYALCLAAQYRRLAARRSTYLAAQYRRLAARRGRKRALVAVAHSLLVIIYHVLKEGTTFQELLAQEGSDRRRGAASVLPRLATRDQAVRPGGRRTTAPPPLAEAGDECCAGFLSWSPRAFSIGNGSRPTAAPSGRNRRRPGACRRGKTPGTLPVPGVPPGGPADALCPGPRAAPPD